MDALEILGLTLVFLSGLIIGHLGLQDRYGAMASLFHKKYGTIYTGISYIASFGTIVFMAIVYTPWHIASGLILLFLASRLLIHIHNITMIFGLLYILLPMYLILYAILAISRL